MWWKLSCDIAAANLQAQRVIALRLMKLAQGGPAAQKEAHMMVSEKLVASAEAATSLASGKSVESVVRRYSAIMSANEKRLSGRKR
jgi:hypothetical protein